MIKLSSTAAFQRQKSKTFYVMQTEVVVVKTEDGYCAVDNRCPHRGAPLCAGEIRGEVLVCPWHGARFDLTTGKGLAGPHRSDLKNYRVQVIDGDIYLE